MQRSSERYMKKKIQPFTGYRQPKKNTMAVSI
jgi:hypothetical protein